MSVYAIGRAWRVAALLVLLLLGGCAGRYFSDAGPAPVVAGHAPGQWQPAEHWTGIVFNGAKIGFSHLAVTPAASAAELRLKSEAALRFRFLMVDKVVNLVSDDTVNADLTLRNFSYDYNLDGNRLRITGQVADDRLVTRVMSGNDTQPREYPLAAPVYPTSAINLYPLLHGLEVGRHYRYQVYDGESQRLAEVTQDVLAYERSELFEGEAFKIKTTLHGTEVTTWLNTRGEPVLELSLGGVFISGLETETQARRYLAQAALNKQETLLDFSRVPVDRPIAAPHTRETLEIALDGISDDFMPPSDARQHCQREASAVVCRMVSHAPVLAPPDPLTLQQYLQPTVAAPSRHSRVVSTARRIDLQDAPAQQIAQLVTWLRQNVSREAVDVFSALDVLNTGKAECQGHSYLYAALARALGLPTRVVNGLVYSEELGGFFYHTWAESWTGEAWQGVDPTLGQPRADATHIKLVEGENLADLAPLVSLLGRVRARVLSPP